MKLTEIIAINKNHKFFKKLKESVNVIPLTDNDFAKLKNLMEKPIPAVLAKMYLHNLLEDDALYDELSILEETDPGRDVRELISIWLERLMPDQIAKFKEEGESYYSGVLSPIHGYDMRMYRSSEMPITGNAYGRFY